MPNLPLIFIDQIYPKQKDFRPTIWVLVFVLENFRQNIWIVDHSTGHIHLEQKCSKTSNILSIFGLFLVT